MTDVAPTTELDETQAAKDHTRKVLIAVIVSVLVILGIKIVFIRWSRHGGPRRAITGIAEEGAVKLADAILDEVLPAA